MSNYFPFDSKIELDSSLIDNTNLSIDGLNNADIYSPEKGVSGLSYTELANSNINLSGINNNFSISERELIKNNAFLSEAERKSQLAAFDAADKKKKRWSAKIST